ncbi:MAG: dihydropteroate synthase [Rhodobacterales bacterium]|nr:dihydropteroate synthase [Rhodobacterales bacterium]MDX5388832.1 dihydropteroate synthase [Rhodobacterales bacterium]MDX5488521.1 dihydropteroate synthase [Rhodobacterales bacterium]
MKTYVRPLVLTGPERPDHALPLAGGPLVFDRVEILSRHAAPRVIPAHEAPADALDRLTAPRAPVAGLDMGRVNIMGILNVTPDSFTDGGRHNAPAAALAHAQAMQGQGADIIDVGGESTRPGARAVSSEDEIARTAPVITTLRAAGLGLPISIDTRKTPVARAAISAGADLVNDVSGFTFDQDLAAYCAAQDLPVCVMHAQGDPQTMQDNPRYDDVLLDVYDFLEARIMALEAQGIPRARIVTDPGIGFGKTQGHNLALMARISLFHALGCPVLLGASRKKFIATLGQAPEVADRVHGSVAVALAAAAQGVQILRVHDVFATRSALTLWQAATRGTSDDA